jgi:hypothetical protein
MQISHHSTSRPPTTTATIAAPTTPRLWPIIWLVAIKELAAPVYGGVPLAVGVPDGLVLFPEPGTTRSGNKELVFASTTIQFLMRAVPFMTVSH